MAIVNFVTVRSFDQGEWSHYAAQDNGRFHYLGFVGHSAADCDCPTAERPLAGGPLEFEGHRFTMATGPNVYD